MHVLLDHVQERVMEVCAGFRDLVMMTGISSNSRELGKVSSISVSAIG